MGYWKKTFWGNYGDRKSYEVDIPDGVTNITELREKLLGIIEPHGFTWVVFLVASSGFLADSYSIFSTNVVSPALAYIYWNDKMGGGRETAINAVTLCGSCIGMVLFGHLADCFGRKRLYGLELVIVIIATLGLTQVSAGYNNSMDPFAWIIWWRLVLGIGIGAEYPLSALIAAEWSPTSTRGTMLAAVFLMQPIGQFLGYIVGYGVLQRISYEKGWTSATWRDPPNVEDGKKIIDMVWRCIIGVGGIPALVAIALRLSIPETPRYLIDVMEDFQKATTATCTVFPKEETETKQNNPKPIDNDVALAVESSGTSAGVANVTQRRTGTDRISETLSVQHSFPLSRVNGSLRSKNTTEADHHSIEGEEDKKEGFWDEWNTTYGKGRGFRRALAGTSICWFLMDFCFYGLGLDTARTLAKIWRSSPSDATLPPVYDWMSGFATLDDNIYDVLHGNAIRALETIPVSAISGSLLFLFFVNYIPRATALRWTFVVLAILFLITGISFISVFHTHFHAVTIVFYALTLFVLNVGPNTILFMLPAELFPTRYRGTCYGIAAASGKLGAMLVQIIIWKIHATDPGKGKWQLAILLICFAPIMLVAAFVAWVWIPEVQYSRGGQRSGEKIPVNRATLLMLPRSLENISENPREGQTFGLREHLRSLFGMDTKPAKSNV